MAEVETSANTAPGVRINRVEFEDTAVTGNPTAPCLVLLHGAMSGIHHWRRLGYFEPLVASGHRVVALNFRGFGKSHRPDTADQYELLNLVEDVIWVLDTLQIKKATVWGYSLGAKVGFRLAALHPERLSGAILGGIPNKAMEGDLLEMCLGIYDKLKNGMEPFVANTDNILKSLGKTEEDFREVFGNSKDELFTYDALVQHWIGMSSISSSALQTAYQFENPVLLYCGMDDLPDFTPVNLENDADLFPNATYHALPGLNHSQAFFHPEHMLPIVLDWLKEKRV